jgi:hypothetical protein
MSIASIVLDGLLKPDGTLVFDAPPPLPPGRVRITLQQLENSRAGKERLPDPAQIDESISAPYDLPRPRGVGHRASLAEAVPMSRGAQNARVALEGGGVVLLATARSAPASPRNTNVL